MLILLLLLAAICLVGIKFDSFHNDYIGKEQTTSIKGIFAIIILFSHLKGYIELSGPLDSAFCSILNYIGQLMVAIFFFYSGYGVLISFVNKKDYDRTFFKNRLLKTLLHFDIAVLIYTVLNLILGKTYGASHYALSFIGWSSVGNSNWFIFDTLALYLVTYFVFLFIRASKTSKNIKITTSILTAFATCALIAFLSITKRDAGSWWYNTLLCYPAGMIFYTIKDKLDHFFKKHKKMYYVTGLFVFIVFIALYLRSSFITYNLCACCFCILIILMNMKLKIENPILNWLGIHSFSIYILQRLPMIVYLT